MLTKEKIVELLRENYPHLAAEYGVKKIGLFGLMPKGRLTKPAMWTS